MCKTKKKVAILACALLLALFLVTIGGLGNALTAKASELELYPNLKFTLINNGTEYSVKAANRNITEAIIPPDVDGIPVTEVAATGFMMCNNLTRVEIPEWVKRIRDSAFMDCGNLTTVEFYSIQDELIIEEDAFSYCNLGQTIVPNNVVIVGDFTFDGNPTSGTMNVRMLDTAINRAMFASYSGEVVFTEDDLILTDTTDSNGNPVKQIAPSQKFSSIGRLVIPCIDSKSGLPIVNICRNAFRSCSLTLVETDTCLHDSAHVLNLESNAFGNTNIDEIEFRTALKFEATYKSSTSHSVSVFANSKTVKAINFSAPLTEIGDSTFLNCEMLTSINFAGHSPNRFPSGLVRIGHSAFENCALQDVYFPATLSQNSDGMKENIFSGWRAGRSINFTFDNEPQAWKDTNWRGDFVELPQSSQPMVIFGTLKYTVTFFNNSTILDSISEEPPFTFAQIVDMVTEPTSTEYDFMGWFLDSTCQNICPLNFQFQSNTSLYAGWKRKTFIVEFPTSKYVDFDVFTGRDWITKIDNEQYEVEYDKELQFTVAIKAGYNQSATPTVRTTLSNGSSNIVNRVGSFYTLSSVISHQSISVEPIDPNSYTITLRPNDGTVSPTTKSVDYDNSYTLPIPTRTGYAFVGWFDDTNSTAIQYTDENGNSLENWNITEDITLYANWEAIKYFVVYNGNKPIETSVLNGSMNGTTQEYGISFKLKANEFSVSKWAFVGWNTASNGSGTGFNNEESVINLTQAHGETITLYAQWKYGVIFDYSGFGARGTILLANNSTELSTLFTQSLDSDNLQFDGWFADDTFETRVTTFSDCISGNITTLYAKIMVVNVNNAVFIVPSNCTRLYASTLNGNNQNVRLKFTSAGVFKLILDNFKVDLSNVVNGGSVIEVTNNMSSLSIHYKGKNILYGGRGADGAARNEIPSSTKGESGSNGSPAIAAKCPISSFTASFGASLDVKGGNGGNGSEDNSSAHPLLIYKKWTIGGNGGNGASAIHMEGNTILADIVVIYQDGSFTITGGNGGNATKPLRNDDVKVFGLGGSGGNGMTILGNISELIWNSSTAATIRGGNGGYGGNESTSGTAGNGGYGIVCPNLTILNNGTHFFYVYGGNGGDVDGQAKTGYNAGMGIKCSGILTLHGYFSIIGGNAGKIYNEKKSGGLGIECAELYIRGSSFGSTKTIYIRGGQGSTSNSTAKCGDGGMALKANNTTKSGSNINCYLTGGMGGAIEGAAPGTLGGLGYKFTSVEKAKYSGVTFINGEDYVA